MQGKGRHDVEDGLAVKDLCGALKEYSNSDFYPFHMPGHKRNPEAFSGGSLQDVCKIDITEVEGFDNLHEANGVLQEAQLRANALFGNAESETFFLVNGSSSGNLAAICATLYEEEEILIARNAHKSVYHAVALHRLCPRYFLPKEAGVQQARPEENPIASRDEAPAPEWRSGFWGAVTAREIEKQITVRTKAVLITSPTYEGMVSDVEEIAAFLHQKKIPLIVDEAHGSHFGLYPGFPKSALHCGADLVIHSLHKTLPSLTQTALLHVQGERIDRVRLRRYLRTFQSTSPSYPLMASLDSCVSEVRRTGSSRFLHLEKLRNLLEERTKGTTTVWVLPKEMIADPCKVVLFSPGKTGRWIASLLRDRYHLEPEMEGEHHVVLILTGYDTDEGVLRLVQAVREINEVGEKENRLGDGIKSNHPGLTEMTQHLPEMRMLPAEAWNQEEEWKELDQSEGRVIAEMIDVYPPGIPLVVPGEEIDSVTITAMKELLKTGANLKGIQQVDGEVCVPVVKNNPLPDRCIS